MRLPDGVVSVIETDRLVLRPPAPHDLSWIAEQMNTPAVMRNLGGVRSPEQVAEGLVGDLEAFSGGGHRRWTVWLRDDTSTAGRRIGRCGLFRIKSDAAPAGLRGQNEIGWTLAEAFWGNGYAAEAARAVLAFGFETLGHPVIFAQTSDSNRASTRLMERLGLERMPALDYVDPDYPAADNPTTVYRMTREQWGVRP